MNRNSKHRVNHVMNNALARRVSPCRRGVLLLVVLVSLALVATLCGVWLKILLVERQQVRDQQSRLQAQLLADAALARAEARLRADATYPGETWEIDAETIAPQAASVTIEVAAADLPQSRRVRVSARIPTGGAASVARSEQRTIALPAETPPPEISPAESPPDTSSSPEQMP